VIRTGAQAGRICRITLEKRISLTVPGARLSAGDVIADGQNLPHSMAVIRSSVMQADHPRPANGVTSGRFAALATALLPISGEYMAIFERALSLWQARTFRRREQPRIALALGGGGVIGGMYEVGALAALEERLNGSGRGFDVYIGCSAGSVVASLLANGVRAADLYRVLDQDLEDPLNFRRGAVFAPDSFRRACGRLGRMMWAFGKNALTAVRGSIPDMLARAERDLPPGFFSLGALEQFMREAFAARGLTNRFDEVGRTLLIPAIDLDRAERVVFGSGALRDVPISQAIAASSAIPGFFEPYSIDGRDYVDGGVGFSGHADLAAEAGADVVFVVHPLVPSLPDGEAPITLRSRGFWTIMEQTSRIYGQNLLQLGLATEAVRRPRTVFFLLEPPRNRTPMFGPSMGFEASRMALRFGYSSTMEWLDREGAGLLRRLLPGAAVPAW
jgi:predicted acylesterase/phospholipase RssA